MEFNNLFSPLTIGSLELKNRFAMAPMGPLGLSDSEGGFNQRGIDYYTERAKGGTGLIITGVTFVDNEVENHGMPNCPNSTHNPVHFVRTSKEMTERIHAYDAKVFLQMSGGFGRVTIPTNLGDYPPVAPSPIAHRWLDKTCRALTNKEIKTLVKKFGEGAYNAKRSGFDGVEIHAVHEGYLIDQFATSLFNQRTDEYGGSLENRLRFAREIVEEIKKLCGEDFPVILRYSPKHFIKDLREGALPNETFVEKGRDLEEGKDAAKLLVEYGYDALDVDVGSYDSWWWSHPPMYQEKGLYRPFCKEMKKVVSVPIICAGRMDNPVMASDAIANGTCDMISLGRPLLADPEYVNKLRRNKFKEVRPCLSCQEACMGRIQEYSMINCAVNPQAGRERVTAYNNVFQQKKVLIVGGGVAGCEAARVLAIRGHKPHLFEKEEYLGGNLIPGGIPDFKEDDHALVRWYEHQLKILNVPVTLGSEITKDDVLNSECDAAIIATGSFPKLLNLGTQNKVYNAAYVLNNGYEICGDDVVIIGGGLVGCETALWLTENGKNVTIVDIMPNILEVNRPLCHANSEMLENLIDFKEISVITNANVKSYKNRILHLEIEGKENKITCDTVIQAIGYYENTLLFDELKYDVPEIYRIGDCRKVANIHYAIWDAFEVANSL